MAYEILATSKTPALVVYVLDVSSSMNELLGAKRRIDVISDAFSAALRQMVFRSTKGARVAPRYRLAIIAYNDRVHDLLDGFKPVDQVISRGIPKLTPQGVTDTARAFEYVEQLLQQELPHLERHPAPLICHMTDGEYTGADPEPIVRRIMNMETDDGNVLVENIFVSEHILSQPIADPKQWTGITPSTLLSDEYAKRLRVMSSPLPESYRLLMQESGYNLARDALMMLPGMSPELVEMGFAMSASTPIAR